LKVNLQTVGCRLNFSEIDAYARDLMANGHVIVPTPDEADLVLVNTCSVTSKAASDSRQKVRQAAKAGVDNIVVTGCWSTMEPSKAIRLPGVHMVVPNRDKDRLLEILEHDSPSLFDLEPIERYPLPGLRLRTRAFIKVQDGCDNRCTFCVTTLARGQGRSRPAGQIITEINRLKSQGVKEFVLTGVHLGSWGRDLLPKKSLKDLIAIILDSTDPTRLRLSSLEPWDIEPEFFELWKDSRLCPHLHLPLQSGSSKILKKMARKVTPESFLQLVEYARRAIPNVSISTDVIVGFPGEDDDLFHQSQTFVQKLSFADGHVFAFSPRPGTAAAEMDQQVPADVIKRRSREMRQVIQASHKSYAAKFVGEEVNVLWEASPQLNQTGWVLTGHTEHNLRVKARWPDKLWNQISAVRIQANEKDYLRGDIIRPGS
jgi:threonylcarbamoyladenosine tRNA methylthiotransferase MtaB